MFSDKITFISPHNNSFQRDNYPSNTLTQELFTIHIPEFMTIDNTSEHFIFLLIYVFSGPSKPVFLRIEDSTKMAGQIIVWWEVVKGIQKGFKVHCVNASMLHYLTSILVHMRFI